MDVSIKRLSKKIILPVVFMTTLTGCISSEPEVISLHYENANYTTNSLYEFKEGDMEARYVEDNIIYGQTYDSTKNDTFFNTIDMYSYDLKTNQLEWKGYDNFIRIMDYMSDEKNTYYYEYSGTREKPITSFYRYIDGKNDKKLYEDISSDLFNCPQFLKYKSSFILITSNKEDGIIVSIPNKEGELEKLYTYDNLNKCIIATAKIEGDYLYFEAINEDSKSLYKVNLTDGKCNVVLEDIFDRFTITSSYIVLHKDNQEMIFDYSGELLKIYEYETLFKTARWTSKMKEDEIIVTDFYNNMYYRNLNNDICYKISAEKDPIILNIPVRFLTTEDSVIAESDSVLYQIKISQAE